MKCSRTMKTKITTLSMAATLALATGCDVEVEGEEGNFNFSYLNSSMSNSDDLAEGSRADIRVIDLNTDEAVDLSDVFSEDVDTLDVVDVADHEFTLEAKDSGVTQVTAEAAVEDGKDDLSDSFEVRSASASSVEFDDRCDDGVFVAGAAGRMKYTMHDSEGGELTGYGYYPVSVEAGEDLLPLELEDVGEVNEDYSYLGSIEFFTGAEPGIYELVSELNSESAEFEVVAASDIDELSPFTGDEATGRVDVGDEEPLAAMFIASADEDEVCGPLADVVELTSETPEICEADYHMPFESLGGFSIHSLKVTGLESGTCELEIAIDDTDLSLDVTVDVQ